MTKKVGTQTVKFSSNPVIKGTGVVVGPKEGEGPLTNSFHEINQDELLGQPSWEQAEGEYLLRACQRAIQASHLQTKDVEYFFAGDLLNQTVSSNLTAKKLGVPYYGLFGACSTMTEGLILAAIKVDGGYATHVLTGTSSHNKGAERQFRFPTEYGGQRPPYAQWTATGAGAAVVSQKDMAFHGPLVTYATTGRVLDWGVKDAFDLGSAMAPAAYDTLKAHCSDTGGQPSDYDLILTGDLGIQGSELFRELCSNDGLDVSMQHQDCGIKLYYSHQDVHGGGSGCACSAIVVYSQIFDNLMSGQLNKILVMATGALHNPQIIQQNLSIPSICHGVVLEKT